MSEMELPSDLNEIMERKEFELSMKNCKQRMLADLRQLYDDGSLCDLCLIGGMDVKDTPVKAHCVIVSIFSKALCDYICDKDDRLNKHLTKLRDRQAKPEMTIITFHGYTTKCLRILADLMYHSVLKLSLSEKDSEELINLVTLLEMTDFLNELKLQLASFDGNKPTDFIKIFQDKNFFKLKSAQNLFTKLNKDFVLTYENFSKQLMEEPIETIMRILESPSPYRLKEDYLCQILSDWITFDAAERGEHTEVLLKKISLTQVSKTMRFQLNEARNNFDSGKVVLLEWLLQSYENMAGSSQANSHSVPGSLNNLSISRQPSNQPKQFSLIFGGKHRGVHSRNVTLFDLGNQHFLRPTNVSLGVLNYKDFESVFSKSSIVLAGKTLFMIGGTVDPDQSVNVKRYLIDERRWEKGPNLLRNRAFSASICVGHNVYTVGGSIQHGMNKNNLTYIDSMEVLQHNGTSTPEDLKWEDCGKISTLVYGHTLTLFKDGFLCIGGLGPKGFSDKVTFYSESTKMWSDFPCMTHKHCFHTSTYAKGYVYVFGGANKFGTVGVCERFNEQTMQWEKLKNIPIPMSSHIATEFDGRYIFCFGGKSSSNPQHSNMHVSRYDLNEQRWVKLSLKMPNPCFGGYNIKITSMGA